jgi:hypothetical protein
MGPDNASIGIEKMILYMFAIIIWAVNGGGFFGEIIPTTAAQQFVLIALQLATQIWCLGGTFQHCLKLKLITTTSC